MENNADRHLVTGGARSGKSRYAENLLVGRPDVTYIATGYPAEPGGDPEWAERIAHHQASRPSSWSTIETLEIATVLAQVHTAVMVDCFGLWVTRTFDALDVWNAPNGTWEDAYESEVARLVQAWSNFEHDVIGVTNEVGWGVVPDSAAGRVFADSLGRLNQRLAQASTQVTLLVAGRPIHL